MRLSVAKAAAAHPPVLAHKGLVLSLTLMSEVLGITAIVAASYTAIVAAGDLSVFYRLRTKQYNPPDGGKATGAEQVTDGEKPTDGEKATAADKATATRGLPVSGRFAALLPCAERRRKLAGQ